MSDAFDSSRIVSLSKEFPTNLSSKFIDWFTNSDKTVDDKSKQKAYLLF